MKKIKAAAAVIAASVLAAQPTLAEIGKITYDSQTNEWRIQGSFRDAADKKASVEVLKPGKTIGDMNPFEYAAEITLDENGAFDEKFRINSESGEYMLRIGAENQVFEKNFVYITQNEMKAYLDEINGAADAEAVEDVFERDYGRLKNICKMTLRPEDKSFVYGSLYDGAQEGYKSFEALKLAVAQTALINAFNTSENEASSVKALDSLLEFFDDKYLPAVELWNDSSVTDGKIKASIAEKLKKMQCTTVSALEKEFAETAVITTLTSVNSKGKELKALDIANTLIGAARYGEFKTYSEEKQIKILSSMNTENCAAVSEYAAEFDKAVKNYDDGGSGSTGGSGGGGGGGKGTLLVPTDTSRNANDNGNGTNNNGNTAAGFGDLEGFDWAKNSINKLAAKRVVNGKTAQSFAPADSITREEFAAIAVRALKLEKTGAAAPGFTDVTSDKWFYGVVASGVEQGIIKGISDSLFGVSKNITRQDAAVICRRAAEACGVVFDDSQPKSDDPDKKDKTAVGQGFEYAVIVGDVFGDQGNIADYALPSVLAMYKSEVVKGDSQGNFRPADSLTRAEAAVMLDRLMTNVEAIKTDVKDKDNEIIGKLRSLGIYSGDAGNLTRGLTRYSAAQMLCSLVNLTEGAASENIPSDCAADNANAGYVYPVLASGLMTTENGAFGGENTLTYNEAVKIAVRALGEEELAKRAGNTDADYEKFASKRGILKEVRKTSDGAITKQDFLRLFYNMLDEKVFTAETLGADAEYTLKSDETFLRVYHDIYKDKGTVNADSRAGINGEETARKGFVKIGSEEYIDSDGSCGQLLGCTVTYYYKESDSSDDNEVLYFEKSAGTKLTTIEASDITSFENMTYKYTDESDKTRTYKISKSANFIYNTERLYDYSDEMLNPKAGTITFVDNNGDGECTSGDTVIIRAYKNIVVGTTDATKEAIYDKYVNNAGSEGYSVRLKDFDEYTIKDKHGDVFGLRELREWDVLAALISPSGKYADFTLVDECCGGNIDSVDTSNNEITVAGKTFEFSKDWRGTDKNVKAGKDVTVYWDLQGKVVAVRDGISAAALATGSSESTKAQKQGKIVVLLKYGKDTKGLNTYYIKTYFSDKKFTGYKLSERVKLNSEKYRNDSDEFKKLLAAEYGNAVLIKLNDKNEVDEIVTAANPGEDSQRGFWRITYPGEKLLYKGNNTLFGNRFKEGNNIYTVPEDAAKYDDENSFAYNNASFVTDTSYVLDAYTTTYNGISADAVIYRDTPKDSGDYDESSALVIGNVQNRKNEDGDFVTCIDGYDYKLSDSNYISASYEIDDEVKFIDKDKNVLHNITADDLEPGDIIRYTKNRNVIETIMICYDSGADSIVEHGKRSDYAYRGFAYNLQDNSTYLTIAVCDDPSRINESTYAGGQYLKSFDIRKESLITVVDKTDKKTVVRSGSLKDIVTYKNAGNGCNKVVLLCDWQSFVYGAIVYFEN